MKGSITMIRQQRPFTTQAQRVTLLRKTRAVRPPLQTYIGPLSMRSQFDDRGALHSSVDVADKISGTGLTEEAHADLSSALDGVLEQHQAPPVENSIMVNYNDESYLLDQALQLARRQQEDGEREIMLLQGGDKQGSVLHLSVPLVRGDALLPELLLISPSDTETTPCLSQLQGALAILLEQQNERLLGNNNSVSSSSTSMGSSSDIMADEESRMWETNLRSSSGSEFEALERAMQLSQKNLLAINAKVAAVEHVLKLVLGRVRESLSGTKCPSVANLFTILLLDPLPASVVCYLPESRYLVTTPSMSSGSTEMLLSSSPEVGSLTSAIELDPLSAPWTSDLGDCPAVPSAAPVAVMVQYSPMDLEVLPANTCCVARFGSGAFGNVPVAKLTEMGIPVFTTPAANANAVKELVVCGLLLASRSIIEGYGHVRDVIYKEEEMDYDSITRRIDTDREMFVGTELEGKTLGVIGLGQIGGRVVQSGLDLGMKVIGYDPWISMEATLKLPGDRMRKAETIEELLVVSDYITVHIPYFNRATHHLLDATRLSFCKRGVHLLNFSPAQIIDGQAVRTMYDNGTFSGKYVSDFADPHLLGHPHFLLLPHLGACTAEAIAGSAMVAVETVKDFLETGLMEFGVVSVLHCVSGAIRNSVNFPMTVLPKRTSRSGPLSSRLCIVSRNEPGVLGQISSFLGTCNVNIEQEMNTSRGDIAYMLLDIGRVKDPGALQVDLAKACPRIISSRIIDSMQGQDRDHDRLSTFFNITSTMEEDGEEDGECHGQATESCSDANWSTVASIELEDEEDD